MKRSYCIVCKYLVSACILSMIMLGCLEPLPDFEPVTFPGVPTPGSPANNATEISTGPTFSWTAEKDVNSYILQVSKDPLFGTFVYNSDVGKQIQKKILGLDDTTRYYWRVCAVNSNGPSAFSSVFSFTTAKSPDAPVLQNPADGAVNISAYSSTLMWSDKQAAYNVQVATDSLFTNVVYSDHVYERYTYVSNKLYWGRTYYWRVSCEIGQLSSKWSRFSKFTTFDLINENNMAQIPAGTFTMGDIFNDGYPDEEKPLHTVTLSKFRMSPTEITVKQWEFVMNNRIVDTADGGNMPKSGISWNDAVTFCNRLSELCGKTPCYTIVNTSGTTKVTLDGKAGYRLPSEAEWEYAARGSTSGTKYPGTSIAGAVNNYCWTSANASTVNPVAKKLPNAFGLYDMGGNLLEWVWDYYGTYSAAAQTNPFGPSGASYTKRVLRGGCYQYPVEWARCSMRQLDAPFFNMPIYGFRIVISG